MNAAQRRILEQAQCAIRCDLLTRQLYATDASIYQLEPAAVAFPKTAEETRNAVAAAIEAGFPITPRGAGTGLAGGAVGEGLIVDLARYNRMIGAFDPERRRIRVEPGVVLDQLNAFLEPHGLCFGPDVATSSRATLGGMIANNSSGARAPAYGTTADHLAAVEVVLPDGRTAWAGRDQDAWPEDRARIDALIAPHEDTVRARFHDGIVKRWPGYGLDRYLKRRDLTQLFCSSEGTLGCIVSAELELVPLPPKKGLGLVFFASVDDAMQATVELLDLEPVAIEHIDRILLDQTAGRAAFQPARDLLRIDEEPCEAILLVEFYEDAEDRLAAFAGRKLGLRNYVCRDAAEMALVWGLRKAGLSLLTSRKGPAKPVAGLEDVCVRPADLPAYVKELEHAARPLGLLTSFYGHAASGLVHVRPVVDCHKGSDLKKFRQLAEAAAQLAKTYGGSFAGEHGIGMARVEFMAEQVGPELLEIMRGVKACFDPDGHMNPGKVLPDGRFRIDQDLRQGDGHAIALPFTPMLGFVKRDGSFVDHLEQCNGCGDCRKDTNTMCPTFRATGEEIMVTRGRANTIRAALEHRLGDNGPVLALEALDEALSNCLACKACQRECPSNVDLTLLKSELVHARQQQHGVPLQAHVFSRVDLLGELGCRMPGLTNYFLEAGWSRALMRLLLGVSPKRPLPRYTRERFDRWFRARPPVDKPAPRGAVWLWDDCFVRYNEPHIGQAAVAVLEAAGYAVKLIAGRACCGRAAFSMGRLDLARRFGEKNLRLLAKQNDAAPIVFLEPSCYAMFAQDYAELGVPGAADAAGRCRLFEDFVGDLLEADPEALPLCSLEGVTAIHNHCHAKALTDAARARDVAAHIPGHRVELLDTGCCGMAGAFGALDKKYALSLAVAEPLVALIEGLDPGARVVASGTSCRHQITHLTSARPLHMAELLALALPGRGPRTDNEQGWLRERSSRRRHTCSH